MIIYILICLSLSLAGITGIQFFYLAYLDRLDRDQKRTIRELELHCRQLTKQLKVAESTIAEYESKIEKYGVFELEEDDDEAWADVIEEM